MSAIQVKSHAKINLALNITGKLAKLHKIESIVSFINLHDLIFIKQIKEPNHRIYFYGNFSQKISKNNTVEKLFKILDEKKLLKDKKKYVNMKNYFSKSCGNYKKKSKPDKIELLKINFNILTKKPSQGESFSLF